MVEKSEAIKENVRERYSKVAQKAQTGAMASCCTPSASTCSCSPVSATDYSQKIGYSLDELGELPTSAVLASAGCGNPAALAGLKEGKVVLDLGSGGGIDVFIAAKKVGPTGKVIGVDMTNEMLALARRNAEEVGIENVEFRKGDIEDLPVEDESVDIIISNCVINLAPDKDKVFSEAFRVLKPGGRMLVSDIVTKGGLPEEVKNDSDAWAACISGALDENVYVGKIRNAGFENVSVISKRGYAGLAFSVEVEAHKPRAQQACC